MTRMLMRLGLIDLLDINPAAFLSFLFLSFILYISHIIGLGCRIFSFSFKTVVILFYSYLCFCIGKG